LTALQLGLLYQFLNSPCSVSWITAFHRHFSLKRGESHGTTLTSQQTILANLQKKLRISGGIDAALSKRCIDKCGRLLLESTQDSLRREQFHSGPTAESTLEKKLRLAECYSSLFELEAAQEIASEAFETAQTSLGRLHPLMLQLERGKLYTQARCLERSSTLKSFDPIPNFLKLVEDHVEVFGIDHIETFGCRHDLALMHLMREEYDEARKILEPLHQRTTEKLGRTSRVTHSIANNLAACANMQGDYGCAESVLYTIPGLSEAAAEPLDIDITTVSAYTLHALSILAAVLGARDEDRRSEILHQRVIDGLTVQAGPKARRVFESAINKGQALRDQFKYSEARKHYLEWLKKSDHNYGLDSRYSREMRKRLLDIDAQEKK
jgi:tetratricopeptide (TPR) repeat protein